MKNQNRNSFFVYLSRCLLRLPLFLFFCLLRHTLLLYSPGVMVLPSDIIDTKTIARADAKCKV
mgnify:CR=1 FL=1